MPQTSASNERQIRRAKQQSARDRLNDKFITEQLMSTTQGRRWIWLRLADAQLFDEDTNFDFGWMSYRKGLRTPALRLLRDVNRFCPREYIIMTEEATSISLAQTPQEEENPDE